MTCKGKVGVGIKRVRDSRSWQGVALFVAVVAASLGSPVGSVEASESRNTAIAGSDSDGLIVFVSFRDGNSEIYTTEPDGSNQANLTDNAAEDWEPVWSPDGTRIAFTSDRDGNTDIYTMAADGSDLLRLTSHSARDEGATWSPDGTKLGFVSDRDGAAAIYVIGTDGSGLRHLVAGTDPSWSPDGRSIAFAADRAIHTIGVEGGVGIRLTDPPVRKYVNIQRPYPSFDHDPVWSPDGSLIAFLRGSPGPTPTAFKTSLLVVAPSDPGEETPLSVGSRISRADIPVWAPNGRTIAITIVVSVGYGGSLFLVDLTSAASKRIPVLLPNGDPAYVRDPAWSPDGSRLVVAADWRNHPDVRYRSLYTMASDGSDQTNLSSIPEVDGFPQWQPPDPARKAAVTLLGGFAALGPPVNVEALQLVGSVAARWFGSDRYATAAAISRVNYEPGVPVVYVSTGEDFPDALSVAPLAAGDGGPVLLVRRDSIPAPIGAELGRLAPDRIVVVGGPAVVSEGVLTQFGQYTEGSVSRLAGPNRYATSVEISHAGFPTGADTVLLATGENYPDAVAGAAAAGKLGAPILLSASDTIPQPVVAELVRLDPQQIVLLGGPSALSATVANQIQTLGFSDVIRIAGANRYATAAAISKWAFRDGTQRVLLATGENFPDALAGAAVAGNIPIPVLLVRPDDIPDAVAAEMTRLLGL